MRAATDFPCGVLLTSGLRFALLLLASLFACLASAQDNAAFVSRSGAIGVYAGADFYCTNVMQNTGTTTWTSATGYAMMSVAPSNNTTWGGNRIPIPGSMSSVAPGAQVTFSKLCTAPITPGTYPMQWQVSKSGTSFGAPTPLINIVVYQGADDAQFISSTAISTSIGPSKQFGAILTMKNLGTATWGSGYSLAPMGNNNFGVASLPSSSTVRNASYGFAGAFTAPTTPGTYTFQWRMQHGTVKFGQPTPLLTIVVSNEAAQFVSRSGAVEVYAGTNFYATNTMRNTGTTSWTWSSTPAYWMTIHPSTDTTWSSSKMNLPTTVAPGSTMTTSASCKAPVTPGIYAMQWQMVKNGTPFGEKTPLTQILVDARPALAALCTAQSVATTVTAGQHFVATFTFANVGTGSWPANTVLTSPTISSWALADTPVGATIAPNGSKSFTIDAIAPYIPGTYNFQLRLKDPTTGQYFGYASNAVTINIIQGTYGASPYPGYRGGRDRNSGRVFGTGNTGQLKWSLRLTNFSSTCLSEAIGLDGSILVIGNKTLVALAPDGSGIRWSLPLVNDTVQGGPVVGRDGTIYLATTWLGNVMAIDPQTHTVKWSTTVSQNSASSTRFEAPPKLGPDGTIYVQSNDSRIHALDSASGLEKWAYGSPSSLEYPNCVPAIGSDGTVYVTQPFGVAALDPNSGLAKWFYSVGMFGSGSPTISADGTIYAVGITNPSSSDPKTREIVALNPDGTLRWKTVGLPEYMHTPAIGADGTLFSVAQSNVIAINGQNGTIKWTTQPGTGYANEPEVTPDGTLLLTGAGSNRLYALDSASGLVKWSFFTGDFVQCMPAVDANGTIYFQSMNTTIYALK